MWLSKKWGEEGEGAPYFLHWPTVSFPLQAFLETSATQVITESNLIHYRADVHNVNVLRD